jgi:hypothetical protein
VLLEKAGAEREGAGEERAGMGRRGGGGLRDNC